MPVSAIVVDEAPDPVSIALGLRDRPGLSLLHDARGGPSYVACDPVETSEALLPPVSIAALPGDTRGRAPRWIGALPYECARHLERPRWGRRIEDRPPPHLSAPLWHRYDAVVEVDPGSGKVRVVGEDPRRVEALARELQRARNARSESTRLRALPDDDPPAAHVARVRRAQTLIAAGDLYQVNLARRLRFEILGSALDLYVAMAQEARVPFGAFLDLGPTAVCASSPELFLSLEPDGAVTTAPIKGTRPRGRDAAEDGRLARELDESPKERAELTMILDVERNDLGRVARTGSVRVTQGPSVDTFRTIHHRAAVVRAHLRANKTAADLVAAMFPSGSVTGAPKLRAMEVIAALEPARRGLYTGAFGAVSLDGSLTLAMAIRVVTVRDGEAHFFAGGGIVADSDPEAELLETRWKGLHLGPLLDERARR
jgi:anthranilate/para-aminobenzoate synthase component I